METVGFYDPMGGPVLFVFNDGGSLKISRGAAAGEFPVESADPIPVGPFSLFRILSGGPGYQIDNGDVGRTEEGEWVFENGRQRLFSDPQRLFLARAEYRFRGAKVAVSYPERESAGPPPSVSIEAGDVKVRMRRDIE